MKISVLRTPHPRVFPNVDELGFGRYFADHMFLMNYDQENGWHDPRVVPYETLGLDPANLTLHYGQTIFEGLKAFRWNDGSVNLFRVNDHVQRFSRSAAHLCIPAFEEDVVLEGIKRLVDVDRNWVPAQRGTALYLRPTLIATDNALGVRPSKTYMMFIICSPVGNYYAKGMAPTRILVEQRYSRAAHGGLGDAKTAANYAASLLAAEEAKRKGFDQVLWLDADTHNYAEEVGTMNIFFVINGVLVTPPLGGTILDGITRRTVLALASEWGVPTQERPISMHEVTQAHADGTLQEVFGSGTAAVISQVGELYYQDRPIVIEEKPGSLRERLYKAITGIQYGEIADTHHWITPVPVATNGNGNGHAKKELAESLGGDISGGH
ncbi:MAG TPA: branched-chain amino acid aminotransferase [Candidatus Kapabacteria bacterium]|nr:branched-chain amino acid aminotransferase [Candidatus Kapabacteria bacterium]